MFTTSELAEAIRAEHTHRPPLRRGAALPKAAIALVSAATAVVLLALIVG